MARNMSPLQGSLEFRDFDPGALPLAITFHAFSVIDASSRPATAPLIVPTTLLTETPVFSPAYDALDALL
jgi:hypothetical protein